MLSVDRGAWRAVNSDCRHCVEDMIRQAEQKTVEQLAAGEGQ